MAIDSPTCMPDPLSRYGLHMGTVDLRVSGSLDGRTGGELGTPRHSPRLPLSTLTPAPPPFVRCDSHNQPPLCIRSSCAASLFVRLPIRLFVRPHGRSLVHSSTHPFARGPVHLFNCPFAPLPTRFLLAHLPSDPALTRLLLCSSTSPLRVLPGRLSDQLPIHPRTHLSACSFSFLLALPLGQ